jgi:hypothetical protein
MYKQFTTTPQNTLFSRLEEQLDRKHPLYILSNKVHWDVFETEFSRHYHVKKGVFGDAINVMLSAIAYNFKRAMKVLFALFLFLQKVRSGFRNPKQSIFTRRLAYAMSFE